MAPVAGTAGGCHFCTWATAAQQQLRLVAKLSVGAGGLLVREQGELTSYRRFWDARSGHVDRQNLDSALGSSPAAYRNRLPKTRSSNGFCRPVLAGSVLVAASGSALRSSDPK